LSTAMICSSVYFLAFIRVLLMNFYHRKTLRATGLVYRGRVTIYQDLIRYLGDDAQFGDLIMTAYHRLQERVKQGYKPVFKANDTAV